MADIIKEILSQLPTGKISDAVFEGANIVLYTKDKDYFLDNKGTIKKVVDDIKKRVELRSDPSICEDAEKTKEVIEKLMPEEAGLANIIFDPQRSQVIIEAEKPGVAIGKQGSILREIKEKCAWVPMVRRSPIVPTQIVENIRSVLYQNNDERRKFLHQTGKRIYDGWIRGKKNEWVRVTYLGGGRQVGRSCILLQTPESRVLLDCGIDPSRPTGEEGSYPFLEAPEFNIQELDAIIISHAHLDHTGFLPYLFKYGYRGPVYCTTPTRDVMALLQLDMVKIARNEGKEPLYSSEEVKEMVKHTICVDYEEVTDITPDVRITMYNSGHILGSAMVHLHIGNGLHNLLYGADMKYGKTQLLDPAVTSFPRLETLMIESTYGGKENNLPSREENEKELGDFILGRVKEGGKVLIPVLGVGRAQEVMLIIEGLIAQGHMEKIPVYIDGMVWDVTAIHTAYPEYLNANVRKQIFHKDNNPFLSDIFKKVGSTKERTALLEETGPCVILATSGMLVGGPSVEYLRFLASGKQHGLCFVCYQPEGSIGKRIQRGETEIMMPGSSGNKPELMKVNLNVLTIDGFTGHSGRNELMSFVQKCHPRPKKIIVNHGENSRCLDLASSLHKQFRVETNAPRNLEALRLK